MTKRTETLRFSFSWMNVIKICFALTLVSYHYHQQLLQYSLQLCSYELAFVRFEFDRIKQPSYFNLFHISIVWKNVQERLSGTVSIKHLLSICNSSQCFSFCVCRVVSRLTSSVAKWKLYGRKSSITKVCFSNDRFTIMKREIVVFNWSQKKNIQYISV